MNLPVTTNPATVQAERPDPLERLAFALLLRLGPAWVPDTRPGEAAVTLRHMATGWRAGADPRERRIVLQAWTKGARDVSPVRTYTPEFSGFDDLEHWLSCGDLANASAVMTATLTQLLDQLPGTGDHFAIEEVLADQASELVERTQDFAAGLIRREPVAVDARRIASLAAQLLQTAGHVDERRSH